MAEESAFRAWACGDCGAGSAQALGTDKIRCEVCTGVTEFRRCPKCHHGLAVSPQVRSIRKATLRCSDCGEEGHRKKFPSTGIEDVPLPSGFVDAYQALGLSYETCAGFTGRRAIHGALVGGQGVKTADFGGPTGVSLYFEPTVLVACIGTMANAGCIPMADLTSLTLQSRAEFLASVESASSTHGSLAASVASSLSMRPPSATETVCNITWDDGAIVVLNQTLDPSVANERFEPVLHRAYRARSDARGSMLDQVAMFAVMQEAGMLSEQDRATKAAETFQTPSS